MNAHRRPRKRRASCGFWMLATRRSCVGCGMNPGELHANGLCASCQHPDGACS